MPPSITAEELAEKIKEISIAEFFEKNRHLLGYENPSKGLLTVVKEGCENSLDACEEAGILPNIFISLKAIGANRFKVMIEDNGPGVVASKVPIAFEKFLVGSKFHRLRQSRGIQGIGIHGAILYSQLTTGKSVKITSSTGDSIHEFDLMIDVTKNEPQIISHKIEKNPDKWHGVKIEMETEGKYVDSAQSIPEYLKQTAMANPFAKITFEGPNGKMEFDRATKELPKPPKEIKPHPYGIELGILRRMATTTKTKNITSFLMHDFSRVGARSAEQILRLAKVDPKKNPQNLTAEEMERVHKSMQMVKLIAPPTDVLSPLGEKIIEEGMKKEIKAEHYVAIERPPTVYRGFPFQVEVGLAFGGELDQKQPAQLFRFANKIPLLYHQGDCATTQSVEEVDWNRYNISQSQGQIPYGPLAIFIHFISVWVPFTSEGKQAIASYPEIIKEMKLALQDAGRELAIFIRQKRRGQENLIRRQIFERYLPVVANSLGEITRKEKETILSQLESMIKKKTQVIVGEENAEEAGPEKSAESSEEKNSKERRIESREHGEAGRGEGIENAQQGKGNPGRVEEPGREGRRGVRETGEERETGGESEERRGPVRTGVSGTGEKAGKTKDTGREPVTERKGKVRKRREEAREEAEGEGEETRGET